MNAIQTDPHVQSRTASAARVARRRLPLLVLLITLSLAGCATLQGIANLRYVDFSLGRLQRVELAGVDMTGVRSYDDLNLIEAGRIGFALARNSLPLEFIVSVEALNPADNQTTARLTRMEWTLFMQDRETVSGIVDDDIELLPGVRAVVPVTVRVDLVDFFEGSGQDLAELVLSVLGAGGSPKELSLRAIPTITTPLGPIRYPSPITIVSGEVGQ